MSAASAMKAGALMAAIASCAPAGRSPTPPSTITGQSTGAPVATKYVCRVPVGSVKLRWTKDKLIARLAFPDPLDERAHKALDAGSEVKMSLRIYAFGEDDSDPFALGAGLCTIKFEASSMQYVGTVVGGGRTVKLALPDYEYVTRACFGEAMALTRDMLTTTPAFLGIIIDVDPPPELYDLIAAKAHAKFGAAPLSTADELHQRFDLLFCGGDSSHVVFRSGIVPP